MAITLHISGKNVAFMGYILRFFIEQKKQASLESLEGALTRLCASLNASLRPCKQEGGIALKVTGLFSRSSGERISGQSTKSCF